MPSLRHAKFVNARKPHVFFVEEADANDDDEEKHPISVAGPASHVVTLFEDSADIAVVRYSCSVKETDKERFGPKKVGQYRLARLPGHPQCDASKIKKVGRKEVECQILEWPVLVHSMPETPRSAIPVDKKRRTDASPGSSASAHMGEDGADEGEIEGEIAKEVLEMYSDQAGRQNTDQGEKISRDVMKFSGSLNIEGDSKVSGSLNIGGSVTIAESLKVGEHGEGAIWGTVHGKQADHAEWMPRHDPKEELHPGDVVALTPDIDGRQLKVSRSAFGSERAEWTVVPTEPQILGHYPPASEKHLHVPVVLVGQVPVRVEGCPRASRYLVPSGHEDGRARELREDDEDDDPLHVFGQVCLPSDSHPIPIRLPSDDPLHVPGQVVDTSLRSGLVEARVMPGINSIPLALWHRRHYPKVQARSSRTIQAWKEEVERPRDQRPAVASYDSTSEVPPVPAALAMAAVI